MRKITHNSSSLSNFLKTTCILAALFCTIPSFANSSTNSLHRLQLGTFPNRTEVNKIEDKLHQLDFETWIIPLENGYAVSVGAFSSQSNLDRAVQRLTLAGFSDKTQVIEVNKNTKPPQTVTTPKTQLTPTKTQTAQPTPTPSKPSKEENQNVPKKQYDKLTKEVEILKNQVKLLLEQNASESEKSKFSKEDTKVASSEQPADSSTMDDMSLDEGDRQEEADDAKRQLDMFLRDQKVLFKKGELELEFGLNYSQDTSSINCFNPDESSAFCQQGSRPVPKLFTRTIDSNYKITYGIADDLAISFSLPYSYLEREEDLTPFNAAQPVTHDNFSGIGDISGSLSYKAWAEKGNMPSVSLSLNAKAPTGDEDNGLGTGFWNIGAGISLTKTIDPVVFFGSLGYSVTLPENGVRPGDLISYSFGSGFSLNDRVSIKVALSGSVILRTEANGFEVPGSAQDISSLQFSSTIKLSKALFVEPFVAFGLTEESSDYTVGIRVPYRFDEKYPLPFFSD